MILENTRQVRLGIVGTGGIGALHVRVAAGLAPVTLVALSSLDDTAPALADELGVPLFRDYRSMTSVGLDAVIVAAPNSLHGEIGEFFATQGVHVLVEKPIADTLAAGRQLCETAEKHGVHLLVGHHRRHQNLVRSARNFVDTKIGTLIATNTLVTMRKPDSYYDVAWRRRAEAGPLLVNLIHEVDLLRSVCGEITQVQAASARLGRDFAFDDTATMIFHYATGALGTLIISESTTSPWSWEASVSDGMGFHNAGQDHANFIGTEGSLSFPSLTAWSYDTDEPEPGWESPLRAERLSPERNNPYVEQIEHFARVVLGEQEPLASGRDGLRSLAVVHAVIQAAETGATIDVDSVLP